MQCPVYNLFCNGLARQVAKLSYDSAFIEARPIPKYMIELKFLRYLSHFVLALLMMVPSGVVSYTVGCKQDCIQDWTIIQEKVALKVIAYIQAQKGFHRFA